MQMHLHKQIMLSMWVALTCRCMPPFSLSSFIRFSVSWYSSNSPFTSTPSKSNLHTNQHTRTVGDTLCTPQPHHTAMCILTTHGQNAAQTAVVAMVSVWAWLPCILCNHVSCPCMLPCQGKTTQREQQSAGTLHSCLAGHAASHRYCLVSKGLADPWLHSLAAAQVVLLAHNPVKLCLHLLQRLRTAAALLPPLRQPESTEMVFQDDAEYFENVSNEQLVLPHCLERCTQADRACAADNARASLDAMKQSRQPSWCGLLDTSARLFSMIHYCWKSFAH